MEMGFSTGSRNPAVLLDNKHPPENGANAGFPSYEMLNLSRQQNF